MEDNKRKIELDLEVYESLIKENTSLKKDIEYANKSKEVEMEMNSHTPPQEENKEKPKKKGIF